MNIMGKTDDNIPESPICTLYIAISKADNVSIHIGVKNAVIEQGNEFLFIKCLLSLLSEHNSIILSYNEVMT